MSKVCLNLYELFINLLPTIYEQYLILFSAGNLQPQNFMTDIIAIIGVIGFFIVAMFYLRGCANLRGEKNK